MNKKIIFLPYDMDTAIGINNEGSLVFSYPNLYSPQIIQHYLKKRRNVTTHKSCKKVRHNCG